MTALGPATKTCHACGDGHLVPFLDLGLQPMAGWFPLPSEALPDAAWPLRPAVCPACWLVQLADPGPAEAEIPGAPPPTGSASMAAHARAFVADLRARAMLRDRTRVVEVASHGGYLQPYFAEDGVATTVLEAEPARAERIRGSRGAVIETSLEAVSSGETLLARGQFDLFVDHYLLAHLDAPEAALAGITRLLTAEGTAVLEFDHLLPTIEGLQFDAFRHGHRSYLSLTWLAAAAQRHGLSVTDVAEQSVYGGALRVYLRHAARRDERSASAEKVLAAERAAGLAGLETYHAFSAGVVARRASTVAALAALADGGRPMMGYGAPARAVTLLNYYGLGAALMPVTADASRAKQGRCIPGVRTPIVGLAELRVRRPSDLLILVWDLAPEVIRQIEAAGAWGARYWVPIPGLVPAVAEVAGG
ncbi:MAG: class I SAM-dependent methyltransferase [Candidatus Limnocylindrales bacterium]